MTADLADFEAENSNPGRNSCTVARAADSLPEEDRSRYLAALARPWEGSGRIEHAAVARWLGKHGVRMSATTVGRHRSGQCSCPK